LRSNRDDEASRLSVSLQEIGIALSHQPKIAIAETQAESGAHFLRTHARSAQTMRTENR
jgi:hypothetical protein